MRLDDLNDMQQEAVRHTEGPLLIIAGAGSGKTRVLTHRVAYLIKEKKAKPWEILAVTFTNKAAKEMKERIDSLVTDGADSIWVGTFHAMCARMLRRFGDRIGYDRHFTIYDADDSKQIIKEIMNNDAFDETEFAGKYYLNAISSAKDSMISPLEYEKSVSNKEEETISIIYKEYQNRLRRNNALDFDDLIFCATELLTKDKEVLDYYQGLFKYIMIDEYQDTNLAQFKLVQMLAGLNNNVCVVGDDDQSIYRFRGANIENILSFEKSFKNATVIKLEQNYRSTQTILDTANAVIKNNIGRKDKVLWTDNEVGDKVEFHRFGEYTEEAEFVANSIKRRTKQGFKFSDMAILYRTNAQSRVFERSLNSRGIPYKIFGGINFYARKEIKDLLAYLRTIDNGRDDLSVKRIINIPKRGIGAKSIENIEKYALKNNISFYDALEEIDNVNGGGRIKTKVDAFTDFISTLRNNAAGMSISEILDMVIDETGYVKALEAEKTEEAYDRIDNINELKTDITEYEDEAEEPSISDFLEGRVLSSGIDELDELEDYVPLMTIHSAKGLEFDNVYLVGMDDGLFPSYLSITSGDPLELEEERRLCYVGITRAKKRLAMTSAEYRKSYKNYQFREVSRFVKEIPKEMFSEQIESDIDAPKPEPSPKKKAKDAFTAKPFSTQQFEVKFGEIPDYVVGDRVSHVKFGLGTVLDITAGGRDYEVKVEFDEAGIKKMFASFANLKKQ